MTYLLLSTSKYMYKFFSFIYVIKKKANKGIVSDPNHKLKALLPPDYNNSRYNLLYMRCPNSPGCSFITLIFMLYILTYFNMNMLYKIFNIILKISF